MTRLSQSLLSRFAVRTHLLTPRIIYRHGETIVLSKCLERGEREKERRFRERRMREVVCGAGRNIESTLTVFTSSTNQRLSRDERIRELSRRLSIKDDACCESQLSVSATPVADLRQSKTTEVYLQRCTRGNRESSRDFSLLAASFPSSDIANSLITPCFLMPLARRCN